MVDDIFASASPVDATTPIEQVTYAPPTPRCGLNFVVHLAQGIPLDDTWIRLQSFKGSSQTSQPFDYQLDLRSNDHHPHTSGDRNRQSKIRPLSASTLLGRPATISLQRPLTDGQASADYSHINGIISDFSMVEAGVYHASLKPALWRLTLANDYRLFSNMTIKDVIQAVVESKHKIACDLDGITGLGIARKQDWLQAGEPDLQFITRLMDKVNIYYYFVHEYGEHKVIFANKPHYFSLSQRKDSNKPLVLYYTFSKLDSLEQDSLIYNFSYKQNLTSSSVFSSIAEPQAAWQSDATATSTNYPSSVLQTPNQAATAADAFHHYQIFQYGSSVSEAEDFASAALNRLCTSATEISGQCSSPELKPGHLFVTQQHQQQTSLDTNPIAVLDMRPEFHNKAWVVTQISETAKSDGSYQCQFSATSANGQIAPFNINSTHIGSILATVTSAPAHKAKSSRELHYLENRNFSYDSKNFESTFSGQYACKGVYVKFSTDGKHAEPTWVKLAQHMQTIPEVDVVVLVGRSQDDSEIPEIQSIVQAKGNKNVNPKGYADNTSIGDSYSASYGDSHSIRYGKASEVDLKGAQAIIDEQYQKGIFKDVGYSQGAGFSYSTSENGKSGVLSHSHSYGCTFSVSESASSENHSTVDDSKNYSNIGNSYGEMTVTGLNENVSSIKKSKSFSVLGSTDAPEKPIGYDAYVSVNTNKTIGDSYGKSTTIGSAVNESSVSGQAKTKSKFGSVHNDTTITGGSHSTTTLTGGSYNWSKTDTSNNINILGASVNTSVQGASNNVSVTGAQANESVTGASVSVSFTGTNNAVQITGISNTSTIALTGLDARKEAAIKTKAEQIDATLGQMKVAIRELDAKL